MYTDFGEPHSINLGKLSVWTEKKVLNRVTVRVLIMTFSTKISFEFITAIRLLTQHIHLKIKYRGYINE